MLSPTLEQTYPNGSWIYVTISLFTYHNLLKITPLYTCNVQWKCCETPPWPILHGSIMQLLQAPMSYGELFNESFQNSLQRCRFPKPSKTDVVHESIWIWCFFCPLPNPPVPSPSPPPSPPPVKLIMAHFWDFYGDGFKKRPSWLVHTGASPKIDPTLLNKCSLHGPNWCRFLWIYNGTCYQPYLI